MCLGQVCRSKSFEREVFGRRVGRSEAILGSRQPVGQERGPQRRHMALVPHGHLPGQGLSFLIDIGTDLT